MLPIAAKLAERLAAKRIVGLSARTAKESNAWRWQRGYVSE
jgi:hypothetical protein